MTLTHEHVQQLTAPFPANEHEWFNGLAYVDELAVCTRLDSVDPSWEYTRVGEPVYGDNRVTIFMRMTVCGVTREDAGTSKLTGKKRDGGTFEIDEPEKNALTDALRRCARRFGIGRYLTILPNTVKDERALEDWINRYLGMPQNTAQKPANNAPAQPKHSTPAKALETPEIGTKRAFDIVHIETELTKDGKPYYNLFAVDDTRIITFSRDIFRVWGYADDVTDSWKEAGFTYDLDMPQHVEAKLTERKDKTGTLWAAIIPEVSF